MSTAKSTKSESPPAPAMAAGSAAPPALAMTAGSSALTVLAHTALATSVVWTGWGQSSLKPFIRGLHTWMARFDAAARPTVPAGLLVIAAQAGGHLQQELEDWVLAADETSLDLLDNVRVLSAEEKEALQSWDKLMLFLRSRLAPTRPFQRPWFAGLSWFSSRREGGLVEFWQKLGSRPRDITIPDAMAFDKFVDCARLSMDDRTKIRSLFADKATDFWGEPGRLHLSALEASYFDRFVDLPGDLHEHDGIDDRGPLLRLLLFGLMLQWRVVHQPQGRGWRLRSLDRILLLLRLLCLLLLTG